VLPTLRKLPMPDFQNSGQMHESRDLAHRLAAGYSSPERPRQFESGISWLVQNTAQAGQRVEALQAH
jgi:hypothetical protein